MSVLMKFFMATLTFGAQTFAIILFISSTAPFHFLHALYSQKNLCSASYPIRMASSRNRSELTASFK
jgi:hypothetical protein